MALTPGVGYEPRQGARSLAGNAHGKPSQLLNTSIDPWEGGFDRSKMAGRYGQYWELGVKGPHDWSYSSYLADAFAERTARWNPEYDEYDGKPTPREVNDAYYTADTRVLPLPQPEPEPTPEPEPVPVPEPPPPTPVPPPPAPTPSPGPPLSSVEQSAAEWELLLNKLVSMSTPPKWVVRLHKNAATLGITKRLIVHAVKLKRRVFGEL